MNKNNNHNTVNMCNQEFQTPVKNIKKQSIDGNDDSAYTKTFGFDNSNFSKTMRVSDSNSLSSESSDSSGSLSSKRSKR